MSPELRELAQRLHVAHRGGPPASPHAGLTLSQAYAVAAHNHRRRIAEGELPFGRKIGHTNPANWPAQGIQAPSWGWLYAASTWAQGERPRGEAWREPKVELELVLRLGCTPPPHVDVADTADMAVWSRCIDAVALGLEFVDRPYPAWGGSVADSVAAGGVHAGLWIGPLHPWSDGLSATLGDLVATLNVGDTRSEGGSAGVMGHPFTALSALQRVLCAQGEAPLHAGEWVTTGALAPALPYRADAPLRATIRGPGLSLVA